VAAPLPALVAALLAALTAAGLPGRALAQGAAPPDSGSLNVTHYAQALRAADRTGDYATALRLSRRVFALAPTHPAAVYYLARAFARTGRLDSALALLALEARMGDGRAVERDRAFGPLRTSPRYARRFARVAAAFAANRRPVVRSVLAFRVPDPDLLPEALAYDSATGSFFVGSLARRKVIRVRPGAGGGAAQVEDFAGPADDILRVVGIKLDAARGRLWFATWEPGLDTARSPARRVDHTRLFAYDARTGARLAAYAPRDSTRPHLFNDLVVTPAGDVYVTDQGDDAVYRIRAGVDTLELFARPDPARFVGPNGIALSGDGRRLYVAFVTEIATVELATGRVAVLGGPPYVATGNVDGLAWYENSLIAVQMIPDMQRVVRFHLDRAGRRVRRVEILERAHPAWRAPTTGAIVGDAFYYIPASSYDRLADDGTLTPAARAAPTPFFRIDLRRR
jgi:sugar lactone lactonase YvrE